MIKRIKRTREFELSVQIKDDQFIRPPHDRQRSWLLNRSIAELSGDLYALDQLAQRFVPGTETLHNTDRTQAELSDQEIMEDWQVPLMQAMADIVTSVHGDVLEIGFGRGVSSSMIQQGGVRSHTIIECNDSIVQRFDYWRQDFEGRDIRLVHGLWQDTLDNLGLFDGVFFHTYPLNEEELLSQIGESVTFADHFFPHAAAHLHEGGVFTYLSNEIDSLSRTHQRLLFRHFQRIETQLVKDLAIPDDVHDAWWSDSMVVVKAVK
ncbi:MAG: class I SAM-dependent methyltransferase [Gammaproteobacteria bacterium]|nr:class I SAM-dependent methyltransferase [Gammaproteobacteria bacterium]